MLRELYADRDILYIIRKKDKVVFDEEKGLIFFPGDQPVECYCPKHDGDIFLIVVHYEMCHDHVGLFKIEDGYLVELECDEDYRVFLNKSALYIAEEGVVYDLNVNDKYSVLSIGFSYYVYLNITAIHSIVFYNEPKGIMDAFDIDKWYEEYKKEKAEQEERERQWRAERENKKVDEDDDPQPSSWFDVEI